MGGGVMRGKRFKRGQEGQAEGVTGKRSKLTRAALEGRRASKTLQQEAAQQEAFLLPFLGEFSTRDVIYEGKEMGEWGGSRGPGRHGNKLRCWTQGLQPAAPLRPSARGPRPWAPPHGHQRHSTRLPGLHPGAWEPRPGRRDATGRGEERPDQRACPSIHHLLTHPSPVHASRLLQLTPLYPEMDHGCLGSSSGCQWKAPGVHPLPTVFSPGLCAQEVPLCVYPSVLSPRYWSCLLSPCLYNVNASITDPGSVLPAVPVSVACETLSINLYVSTDLLLGLPPIHHAGPIIHHLSAYVSFMLPAMYYPSPLLLPL